MKIKEEELKLIQEQQKKLNELISNIGVLETQKHGLLHEIASVNKDIEEYKEYIQEAKRLKLTEAKVTVFKSFLEKL